MYDVAIIGSGPAGIECAKRARNARLSTALIEAHPESFGGTCINTGCIPTKYFIISAKAGKPWAQTVIDTKKIIQDIKNPLKSYLERSNVSFFWGIAQFIDKNTLRVGSNTILAKSIVIATGSLPRIPLKHPKLIAAEKLYELKTLPDRIAIIGAGHIGLEAACLLKRFGKTVTVFEQAPRILPTLDPSLANRLKVALQKQGIFMETETTVAPKNLDGFDLVLAACGREPNLQGLQIETLGVSLNEFGWIETNTYGKTNINTVYACGDITGKHLLAYAAEYQARLVIDNILDLGKEEDFSFLPHCVFTTPQAACVGILEDEARAKNISYTKRKTNFLKFSSSYLYNDLEGYLELVLDDSGRIIGAGVISESAGELINTLTVCLKNGMTVKDLRQCTFVHPTISEAIALFAQEA